MSFFVSEVSHFFATAAPVTAAPSAARVAMAPPKGKYETLAMPVDTEGAVGSATTQSQGSWRGRAGVLVLCIVCVLVGVWLGSAAAAPGDDSAQPSDDVVITADGAVRGVVTGATRAFYQIPYAHDPVGSLRWQPPVQNQPWSGVRDGTAIGTGCVRPSYGADGGVTGSEACLYVNVFAPTAEAAEPRPVMVWFHGGCYVSGSPEGYDGAPLAEFGDVILVTVAFRLNVFGHLGSGLLKDRSRDGSAGNWGIQDQRESLRWVQRSIKAWGGDPSNVLIFGQSSGGSSVASHLVMPPSYPLFHKAIIESGSFSNWGWHSWPAAEQNYDNVLAAAGCDRGTEAARLDCLLAASAETVGRAGNVALPCRDGCAWAPVVDSVEFVDFPIALLAAGRHVRVPLLQSTTQDDGAVRKRSYSSTLHV